MSRTDLEQPAQKVKKASQNGKHPVYSVSTMFFHEYALEDILKSATAAGCNSVEFWLETPTFWVNEMPRDYLSNPDSPQGKAADNHLKEIFDRFDNLAPVTVHTPVLDLNPCSVNPDVAEVSTRWAERALQTARILGAEVLTVHPGRRTAKRSPGDYDVLNLCRFLDRLDAAHKRGNPYVAATGDIENSGRKNDRPADVMVAIENMQPAINALLTSPEQLEYFLNGNVRGYYNNYVYGKMPSDPIAFKYLKMKDLLPEKTDNAAENDPLYFTLDISHALTISKKEVLRYIDMYFDKIVNVHAGGAEPGRVHLPVSYSNDARDVLKYLADCGYTRHITLEIDDLNLGKTFTLDEKTDFIAKEISLLKDIFEG